MWISAVTPCSPANNCEAVENFKFETVLDKIMLVFKPVSLSSRIQLDLPWTSDFLMIPSILHLICPTGYRHPLRNSNLFNEFFFVSYSLFYYLYPYQINSRIVPFIQPPIQLVILLCTYFLKFWVLRFIANSTCLSNTMGSLLIGQTSKFEFIFPISLFFFSAKLLSLTETSEWQVFTQHHISTRNRISKLNNFS